MRDGARALGLIVVFAALAVGGLSVLLGPLALHAADRAGLAGVGRGGARSAKYEGLRVLR